jgi:metallophosphoesterase (TIGR03767 family)
MAKNQTSNDGKWTLNRRRFLKTAGLVSLGTLAAIACRSNGKEVATTLDGTIVLDEERTLLAGPGEPHEVRTDLTEAKAGREKGRRSLAVFHHFSDFRIVDEESPLRSEWVESCEPALSTGAFRPHEALSLHAAAAMIAAANQIDRSPVTGRPVDFALHTGSAVDNAHYNESRWFIDLMDGKFVEPDSGSPGYEGVQSESPVSAYGDLREQAQQPFQGQPLRYPWYAVAGNRDLLAQGNFPSSEAAQGLSHGTQKVIELGPDAREEVCAEPAALLGPDSSEKVLNDPETVVRQVSPDGDRRLLTRKDWIEEHFKTADNPGPLGHGFRDENRQAGTAYYVLEHQPIAFIVLDTVNPGGFSAGSIDATQFVWLEEQLKARSSHYVAADGSTAASEAADRLIVVVSHHAGAALNNPFPDPQTNEDRFRGPQLEALLHRFPNVILHIAGHTLEHRISARPDPAGDRGGYWELTTGSPLDYPMQSRLLEVADNSDGTISLFSTAYDMAAPIVPGDAKDQTPDDGLNQILLASVARAAAVRDPQLNLEAAGLAPSDRNAELLLTAPFDLAAVRTPPHRQPQAAVARRMTRRSLATPFLPPP